MVVSPIENLALSLISQRQPLAYDDLELLIVRRSPMTKISEKYCTALILVFLSAVSLILSSCAPLLIAGGATGGYAVAKHEQHEDTGK